MSEEVYEKIIDKLIRLVSDGTLKPDGKVYSENRMSIILGVPRAQVREVYSGLSILGILEARQGEGTFFQSSTLSVAYKVLFLMLLMEKGGMEETIEARKIMESGAAELACLNRKPEDLAEMERCYHILSTSDDPQEITNADAALHYAIAKASGNSLVEGLVKILSGYVRQVAGRNWNGIVESGKNNVDWEQSLAEHRAIIDAIRNCEKETARNLVHNHLDSVRDVYGRKGKYVDQTQSGREKK
ncbi:MAG: FadR family transcriptional regulator [Clostridiales bacterium]|nr:FadR family transcriptional regulator [Clostridiales bacterium]